MSFGKILGLLFFGFVFLLLTVLKMTDIIIISDDAAYVGILIYVGCIVIVLAIPEEDI